MAKEKEPRRLLGEQLDFDDRLALAQLTRHHGWPILVKLMGEACRKANEAVIRLDPTEPRYPEVLTALQTTARAMNQFSADVLDSMRVHFESASKESQQREAQDQGTAPTSGLRFDGFRMPIKSPTEGQQ